MLERIDQNALFYEIHRTIEEAAVMTVHQVFASDFAPSYPPNAGFLSDEEEALSQIPRTAAMERALRKLIADAAAGPMFHLFCLADGVVDPPELIEVAPTTQAEAEITLHDQFYDSYWSWRKRRPNPGWRLDTYEGD